MKNLLIILFSTLLISQSIGQNNTGYLTEDGAWCWFSDPRAIISDNSVYTGWVKTNGTIEAVRFDTKAEEISDQYELYSRLEADDHDNPAFAMTGQGNIIMMYTRHSKKDLFINTLHRDKGQSSLDKPQLIHPVSDEEMSKFPRETVTYANPFTLKKEQNRIYCFGRWTGFKPNMMWSDDHGSSWTKSKVFITNYPFDPGNRPYVKYFSDGESKIHVVFTDGHPRNEPVNSVYYAGYENGAFHKASGKTICKMEDIPFEPKNASIVYKATPETGRAWIADIGQDEQMNPVILYTRSPEETNHEYWYARYTKNGWENIKLCDSGKWFPQTQPGKVEREPHYFGGITIHPDNSNVVYLSRQIDGVFEIERWETTDSGKTWDKEQITSNSEYDNVRPFIPRGLKAESDEIVLWMENQKYIHYTIYNTSIKYYIRK